MEETKNNINLSAMKDLKDSYMKVEENEKHTLSCARLVLKEETEKLKVKFKGFMDKHFSKEKIANIKKDLKYTAYIGINVIAMVGALGGGANEEFVMNTPKGGYAQYFQDISTEDKVLAITAGLVNNIDDTGDIVSTITKLVEAKNDESKTKTRVENRIATESIVAGSSPKNNETEGYIVITTDDGTYKIPTDELDKALEERQQKEKEKAEQFFKDNI